MVQDRQVESAGSQGPETASQETAAAEAKGSTGPLAAYRARRRAGELRHDPGQELAAEKLQSLHNALRHYEPAAGSGGWKARFGLARRRTEPPMGLYIFGGVGTGKSMLMDLFFDGAPLEKKRRVHFHAFMQEMQERLHSWRQDEANADKADPLPELAGELAQQVWLLCFDEFHVANIADAMILGRFFETLFEKGVVVVATSNWPPDRLYEGGLQRERFLPFVALVKQRLDVLELDGGIDYRQQRLKDIAAYHAPLGPKADAALDRAFAELTEGAMAAPDRVLFKGREIPVPLAAARGRPFFFCRSLRTAVGGRRLSGHRRALSHPRALRRAAPIGGQAQRGAALHDPDRCALRTPV